MNETGAKNHLMLGNGFSVAFDKTIFNYKSLSEALNYEKYQEFFDKDGIAKQDIENLKKAFNNISNYDYENLMNIILQGNEYFNAFGGTDHMNKEESCDKIKSNTDLLKKLKKILITIIAITHPEASWSIPEKKRKSCCEFLQNFIGKSKENGKIYTFNYDLLLYWVCMRSDEELPIKKNHRDGFGMADYKNNVEDPKNYDLIWSGITQSIYYLHGAMHYFTCENGDIEKLYYEINNNEQIPLKKQIEAKLKSGYKPLFIAEGSAKHKLKRIKGNPYLSKALRSIPMIQGNLVIFGHSLRDEDDHILSIIVKNKGIKNVFISIYGDVNSDENKKITNKIEGYKLTEKNKKLEDRKEYHIFDAETAKVWNKYDSNE